MTKRILIFGLETTEGHDWRKAFRALGDYEVRFIEVDAKNDVGCGVQYGPDGGDLYVVSKTEGYWNPDGAIWRWGAVKPNWVHEPFLTLLNRFTNPASREYSLPMISRASFHLVCANRLRMLSALSADPKIPIVPHFAFVTGRALIESRWTPQFPCVVKIGSFHQGLMKLRVSTEDEWADALSIVFPMEMTVVIEQYIQFIRDLRVLWIGDEMWTMVREFKGWKANRLTKLTVEATPDDQRALVDRCRAAVGGAEYGALDLVETDDGLVVFEINDCPGLDPEVLQIPDTYGKMAALLVNKLK